MKRANKTIMKCYHQELATVDEHTPTCLPSLSPSLLILYICCINCFILIIHVSFKFPAMLAILNHTARHAPRRSFRSSQVWSQPPPHRQDAQGDFALRGKVTGFGICCRGPHSARLTSPPESPLEHPEQSRNRWWEHRRQTGAPSPWPVVQGHSCRFRDV